MRPAAALPFGALVLALVLSGGEAGSGEEDPVPPGAWAGSRSCASCHPKLYAKWIATGHARGYRAFREDAPARPFNGEVFESRGIAHVLGPGGVMEAEGPGGEVARFDVQAVIGVRRVQMFTTELDRGRIQVLPVFVEVPERRWFDYADFIFGGPRHFAIPPDSPNSWYGPARNFNSRCGECHLTGYDVGYDADRGRYASSWQEAAIGCEACHGPSAGHVRRWKRLEEGPDPIVNPARLTIARSNQICGYCHSERVEVATGWRPGDDLFAFTDVHGLEDHKHLYPDGRARELIHNLVPILESRCGPLSCTRCHDPHGSGAPGDVYYPEDIDRSCRRCHQEIAHDIVGHTHHPAPSAGASCVACHMQRLIIEGGHGKTYDHTISIPSPRNTDELGVPNACRSCHLAEEPGWDREQLERLWPGAEGRNHRVRLADVVARGRAGEPEAKEPLLELLRDPNPVYRAGATWLLGPYGVDLRPQLRDPDPMVRRAAVAGVARSAPEALEERLDDASHAVRRAAALALALRPSRLRERPALRRRLTALLERYAG
ncbi:MAG: cytochrome c3 family protein, partial [Planctomycetota bacterium]